MIPDLLQSMRKRYSGILRLDGLRDVIVSLSSERVLVQSDLARKRISMEEAQTLLQAYDQIEQEMRQAAQQQAASLGSR